MSAASRAVVYAWPDWTSAGDHGAGAIHHTGMYIGDGYEIDAPANSATEESPLEIIKVAEHRYADQYAGAARFL